MANAPKAPKKAPSTRRVTKKPSVKHRTFRDVPQVPTAKQIEQSITRGKSVSLDQFVKGVKL